MEKEEEFKVGDRVYNKLIKDKGTITEIKTESSYPFLVQFDSEKMKVWCAKNNLTKLDQIVVEDIYGEERTYDVYAYNSVIMGIVDKQNLNVERKKEKENMENRVYGILAIYQQNRRNEINEEYNKKEEEITKKDSIRKDVETFEKTLRKKYSNDSISLRTNYLSKETSDILSELYKEKGRKEEKLYEFRKEVDAQIKLCDTYDQVIDILVSYDIIDKKTKKIK